MTQNMTLAKIHLEGLIAGMEMNSEIPLHVGELRLLQRFIVGDQGHRENQEALIPEHIAILAEARDFGQFGADVIWTQAKPIREAFNKLLDDVFMFYYGQDHRPQPEDSEADIVISEEMMDAIEEAVKNPPKANQVLTDAVKKFSKRQSLAERLIENLDIRSGLTRSWRQKAEERGDKSMVDQLRGQELEAWNSLQAANQIVNAFNEETLGEVNLGGGNAYPLEGSRGAALYRVCFKTTEKDVRPVNWPIQHPYWVTGSPLEEGGASTLVSYANNREYILANWPEATDIDMEEVTHYLFTSRFPRPSWFKE